jgi:hypothetical protein
MSDLNRVAGDVKAAAFALTAEDPFQLALDNDLPTDAQEEAWLTATIAQPDSIPLDIPTVIDDADYFGRMAQIVHMPAVLQKLQGLYSS